MTFGRVAREWLTTGRPFVDLGRDATESTNSERRSIATSGDALGTSVIRPTKRKSKSFRRSRRAHRRIGKCVAVTGPVRSQCAIPLRSARTCESLGAARLERLDNVSQPVPHVGGPSWLKAWRKLVAEKEERQ